MSEEKTNMAIRDLKHYVIDNMSLDVQDDFEIICKYITNLQQKVEQKDKEIDRLNNIINRLEKYLIEMSDRSWDDNGAYDDVLDKLKKLKEE